jgi:hypothetical protein
MDKKGGEKISLKMRFSAGLRLLLLLFNIIVDFFCQNLRKMDSS